MNIRSYFWAAALAMFFTLNAAAQENATADLHPYVVKMTELLNLSQEQSDQLEAVYADTAKRGEALDAEMKETRLAYRNEIDTATPAQKAAHKERMSDLSKERKMLIQERQDFLQSILTPEQKEIFEAQGGK